VIDTEYLRKTIDSKLLENLITLPDNLKNRQVEIIVLPAGKDKGNSFNHLLGGSLHKYANPSLITSEKEAWQKAIEEKHENS
jgi:hypothetical protein